MSLYNAIFGGQDSAAVVVKILEETHTEPVKGFVRSRAGMVEAEDGKPVLRLHTRSGGGNRECYCDDYGEGEDGHDDACIALGNDWLTEHPWHSHNEDDDFDMTYADFYFKVPADYEHFDLLEAAVTPHVDMSERWQAAIDALTTKEEPNGQ